MVLTVKGFSGNLFVPRSYSFPMNPEKKTLVPYIYNVQQTPFLKFSKKHYKFKIPRVTALNFIYCINQCACDFANWRTTL